MKRIEPFMNDRNSNFQTTNYDIVGLSMMFKNDFKNISKYEMRDLNYEEHRIAPLLYELLDRDLWRLQGTRIIDKYLGYSIRDKSLTVTLYDDEGEPRTICIRHSLAKDGRTIKWKTLGTKRFIPHRIFDDEDPTLFVASGIGEFLLFELLEMNYMVLQSDSIVLDHVLNEYAPRIEDRLLIVLLDNDKSCERVVTNVKKNYEKDNKKVIAIHFEEILQRKVPEKYDFRDFCNEMAKIIRGKNRFADPNGIKDEIFNRLNLVIRTKL